MKLRLIILLLLNCTISFAQKSNTDVQVEYQAFFDTDSPMKMYTTLYAGGNVSVYREKYSTKVAWEERTTPEQIERDKRFGSNGVPEDYFLKVDRNKKEVLFYDDLVENLFLVRDVYEDIKWDISEETKTIAGLLCIKASANFRGREWTAWFAPEIPLAFGPWKLQGLPGIILEAYDSTNSYVMKAVKIEYKKDEILSKDFTKLMKAKNKEPVSYQKFVEENEEGWENFGAESKQEAPKGITVTNVTVTGVKTSRTGRELHFEWEP
jgi:GLPGLI family protein